MKPHRLLILATVIVTGCLALWGCGHLKPAGAKAGAALAATETHNTEAYTLGKEAKANVENALPNCNEIGKQYLVSALRQLEDMLKAIAGEKIATADLRQAIAEKDAALKDANARIAVYDGSWLGGKGERVKRMVLWGAGLLFAGGVVLQAMGLGLGGLFGRALAFVGRVCASVVPFVSTMVHDFFAVIHRDKAVAAAKSEADQSLITEVRRLFAGIGLNPTPAVFSSGAVEGTGAAHTVNL